LPESFRVSVWKMDDFTINYIEHHLFLLIGFSLRTSSQPSFSGATVGTYARQRQGSTRNTYKEERDSIQKEIGSPADGQAAAQILRSYLTLGICLDECHKWTLSLSASPDYLSPPSQPWRWKVIIQLLSYRGKVNHAGLTGVVDHSTYFYIRLREILCYGTGWHFPHQTNVFLLCNMFICRSSPSPIIS
jgi:hypothetical protein